MPIFYGYWGVIRSWIYGEEPTSPLLPGMVRPSDGAPPGENVSPDKTISSPYQNTGIGDNISVPLTIPSLPVRHGDDESSESDYDCDDTNSSVSSTSDMSDID